MTVLIVCLIASPLAAWAAYMVILRRIPTAAMRRAMTAIADRTGGRNVLAHGRRPTAKARQIVMPAPDLIYSSCVFDLSGGPLRFRGPVAENYWSLSAYADNTDNFFVVNDLDLGKGEFDVVLIPPGGTTVGIAADRVVEAPSLTGVVLIRIFIGDGSGLDRIRKMQEASLCEPVPARV
ncbi:MAG TPA: DUF1254 domain-containing protein [Candidatus Cybelea sp.]|nr:DUF1254 domain-containing protein [Candidatus Cybelea sp.]